MAELLTKMRGWVRDEGRPPIVAEFNFNFGPPPGEGGKVIEPAPCTCPVSRTIPRLPCALPRT